MLNIFRTEPALVVGFVVAVVALLVAFGVPITDVQSQAITGLVTAALVLGGAVVTRQAVTPNDSVAARRGSDGMLVSGPADLLAPTGAEVALVPVDDVRVDPDNALE